jgi:hypothetical protein
MDFKKISSLATKLEGLNQMVNILKSGNPVEIKIGDGTKSFTLTFGVNTAPEATYKFTDTLSKSLEELIVSAERDLLHAVRPGRNP